MKLTDVMRIWDILQSKNCGELGYCDIESAIEAVVGIQEDIRKEQPTNKAWRYEGPIPEAKFNV